jgi:hypothetical protein
MTIENTNSVGINGFKLLTNESVFTGVVGLVLQSFNSLIDGVLLENGLDVLNCSILILH